MNQHVNGYERGKNYYPNTNPSPPFLIFLQSNSKHSNKTFRILAPLFYLESLRHLDNQN